MEHTFDAMDSACSVHSNFRPAHNAGVLLRPILLLRSRHVPVPVPVPVPDPVSASRHVRLTPSAALI